MVFNLIVLGFVLSLDNFRTAVILGPLRFAWPYALKIAVVFGFFDAVAPLAGILLGHRISQEIGGEIADRVGAIALGLYGLYLIVRAMQTATQEELEAERRWSIFGLPVPLSLDNVIAGTGLGIVGLSPLVPATLFGAITTLMTLVGLQFGRAISHIIHIRPRWDVVVGVALVIEAFVLAFWLLSRKRLPLSGNRLPSYPIIWAIHHYDPWSAHVCARNITSHMGTPITPISPFYPSPPDIYTSPTDGDGTITCPRVGDWSANGCNTSSLPQTNAA
jgi:putative Mn2+ efflux pump MntP